MPRRPKHIQEKFLLEQKVDAHIAELEKAKAALLSQIEGLKRKVDDYDRETADLHAAKRAFARIAMASDEPATRSASKPGPSEKHANTKTKATPPSSPPPTPGQEVPSMAALIRQLAVNQPGRFTPTTINDIIRNQFPDVFGKMPHNYTSSNLWKLANGKKKPIHIVEQGGPGGVNVYEVNGRPHSS